MTKPGYVVVYVFLICAMTKGGSEGKRWKHDADHVGEKVPHKFYYKFITLLILFELFMIIY